MQLTVLDLGSDPRERGRIHGRSMRSEIRDNYATYVERFQAGGAKLPVVLEQSDAWAAFIRFGAGSESRAINQFPCVY